MFVDSSTKTNKIHSHSHGLSRSHSHCQSNTNSHSHIPASADSTTMHSTVWFANKDIFVFGNQPICPDGQNLLNF